MAGTSGLLRVLAVYSRTAWWGLISPRLRESASLVVAQAVVEREVDGRHQLLLSVRSDVQGWELPGGTLEPGESIRDALKREVEEETGLQVTIRRHVGDYTRTGFRPHLARVYTCRVLGGELRPSSETPRLAWFEIDSLPDTLFPWYDEPIRDALANRDRPVAVREHQGFRAIWSGIRIDLIMRRREARRKS